MCKNELSRQGVSKLKASKKPIIFMILAFVLSLFVACGGDDGNEQYPPHTTNQTESPTIPTLPIQHIPNYIITLNIEPAHRHISGVLHVDFINTSHSYVDNVYFNIPLNSFNSNAQFIPFFEPFEDRIFRHGINSQHSVGYVSITAASANLMPIDFSISENILSLHLPESLPPSTGIDIGLIFEAQIPLISHRTGANANGMWLGNFLPVLSVLSVNGWHNYPYFPAGSPFFTQTSNFVVNITTPLNYSVASSGIATTTSSEFNLTLVEAHRVRDFAFVVMSENYNTARTTSHEGINIAFHWSSASTEINYAEILSTASRALSYFGRMIGPSPYNNLEIVEVNHFMIGTQAYPGIIFVDSQLLRSRAVHNSLARDIAHQWFYNVVGNNPVQDAWLLYGLATFLAFDFLMEPSYVSAYIRHLHENLSNTIQGITYNALSTNLGQFDSWSDFYNIQYIRGTVFFYALQQQMGATTFDRFLRAYYERFAFGIATTADMMAVAEEISNMDLQDFFYDWALSYALPPLPEIINLPKIDYIPEFGWGDIWELE